MNFCTVCEIIFLVAIFCMIAAFPLGAGSIGWEGGGLGW